MQARALEEGSTWKKWDLHVHTPTTRLNNQYVRALDNASDEERAYVPDWERFCRIVEESDVAVFGVTDYFSFDSYFEFKDWHQRLYPKSKKVFFPNLELRLDQSVHHTGQEINAHLLFRDDLSHDDADRFLTNLKTTKTSPGGKRKKSLYELKDATEDELESVSVRFSDCIDALKDSFDDIGDENIEDVALIVISGNKDGLSPGKFNKRKGEVIDEIDQKMHAVFANATSANHWLDAEQRSANTNRILKPHPTFYGCDAHDFSTLEKCLGRAGRDNHREWNTTWVKAETTWSGLLQTLVEPETRVKIQKECPDSKLDYLVIDHLTFDDPSTFPGEVKLNPGLNAIIGSRSSGKSSLLAHMAYSVDPAETVKLQRQAGFAEPGPAAGHSWVENQTSCGVVWRDGQSDTGNVIYIPQNFLAELSGMPDEVDKRILPALEKTNPGLHVEYENYLNEARRSEGRLKDIVESWFQISKEIDDQRERLRMNPSRLSVEETIRRIEKEIQDQGLEGDLSQENLELVKAVSDADARSETLAKEAEDFEFANNHIASESPTAENLSGITWSVQVTLGPGPLQSALTQDELAALRRIEDEARNNLRLAIEKYLSERLNKRREAAQEAESHAQELHERHAVVIDQAKRNTTLAAKQKSIQEQRAVIDTIDSLDASIDQLKEKLRRIEAELQDELQHRDEASKAFKLYFNENVCPFEQRINFSVEIADSHSTLATFSEYFNQRSSSDFMRDGSLDIGAVRNESAAFLSSVRNGTLKTKKTFDPQSVAMDVISKHPEVRFAALMDGDSIGGFSSSTMTPGKQALFALTLILSDAGEEWPLLIDQPEDDLDSRSIYEDVVTFLKTQKQRRQIVMVSHNANLVVGADAELVIVANRHGHDRPNEGKVVFDYRSGGLESSYSVPGAEYELDRKSVREHVIQILDGGEEAFRKRQEKYKL